MNNPMVIHPQVKVVLLHEQLSSYTIMWQRVHLIYQAIPEPADRTAGIACEPPQTEIVGLGSIVVQSGPNQSLGFRSIYGIKPFQSAALILLSSHKPEKPRIAN
jgi:hypothetical protein